MAKREQATPVPPNGGGEWEEVRIGLGDEWDFDNGPLVGDFIGSVERPVEDKRTGEMRDQLVHQFAPEGNPEEIVFLWGSYQLDTAFAKIDAGTRCRVQFAGTRQFSASDGPRVVKQYRVQVAR